METLTVHVKEEEMKIVPVLWFGDVSRDVKVKVVLDKIGSSVKVLCVFFGKSGSFNLKTEVIHDAPNTFSRTLIKGVLDGDAVSNYDGQVVIRKGAKNADADLNEHAILLSPRARATAMPRLEVLENEVKAGHGATVGKIDADQMFYLATRGLSAKEAKQLIVKGFLTSFITEFPAVEANQIRSALALI